MLAELLIASLALMLASLVGVISIWKGAGTWMEKNLNILISFSAGVFIVVALSLTLESFEHTSVSIWILSILGGIALLYVVSKFLPELHHHHMHDEEEGHDHTINPRRILTSDAIHNIADGLVLGAAFAASTPLGIAAAIGIFIHEIVQELSEFFVLKEGGYSTKRALSLNFLVSATLLVGALPAFFLLKEVQAIEGFILGIAAGAFFYTISRDLIPYTIRTSQAQKSHVPYITAACAGIVLMLGINIFLGHGEISEHDDDYDVNPHVAEHL